VIEVNLLPKGYRKKSFDLSLGKTGVYLASGAAGIILMMFGITFYQTNQISELEQNIDRARQRASMLQKDIQMVDALVDIKGKISSRMRTIDKLDSHRSSWVRILEDLGRNVPEFIWLSRFEEMTRDNNPADKSSERASESTYATPTVRQIEIEGYAFSLNSLASFMINMMRSDYFDEVELTSIDEVTFGEQAAYDFVISGNLHYLSDEDLRRRIAQVDKRAVSKDSKTGHKTLN
jgi:Tfp pilus assembly protein PilN